MTTTKTENDLTDEELEELENKRQVFVDTFDKLDILRGALNSSHVEKMYVIKRSTALGPTCPYYLKARRLFTEQQLKEIKFMIGELNRLLEEEYPDV